jgi:hypothetical protein
MWRSALLASSLLIMFPASSPDLSLNGGGDESGDDWKASFYYVVRSPSSDSDARHDHMDQPTFHELQKALRRYREMADGIIRQLSIAHEVASRSEQLLFPHHHRICNERSSSFLSCKLERKIALSARFLEHNCVVLEGLLKPFPVDALLQNIIGLDSSSNSTGNTNSSTSSLSNSHFTFPSPIDDLDQSKSESFQWPMKSLARYIPPYKPVQDNANAVDEAPYNTASLIITHIARDWTACGESIRQDTHDWIVDKLWEYHNNQKAGHSNVKWNSECYQHSPLSPVLVPGAGMARLAFDIAFANTRQDTDESNTKCYPFVVEAVDNSIVMAAAAYYVFHHAANRRPNTDLSKVYPIVSDPFTNEVDTRRRWEAAEFPEDKISEKFNHFDQQQSDHQPRLSYVIGDFVSVYASPSKHGVYGSIVTCFFIDTATNIYEYIITIRNLLKTGGVWFNLGPVQWHQNAQLQPTTDELKGIILLAGFKLVHWEINDKLLAYRHPEDILAGTRAEAYRPLKFVVVLGTNERVQDDAEIDDDLISSMEKLRQVTGRSSLVPKHDH